LLVVELRLPDQALVRVVVREGFEQRVAEARRLDLATQNSAMTSASSTLPGRRTTPCGR